MKKNIIKRIANWHGWTAGTGVLRYVGTGGSVNVVAGANTVGGTNILDPTTDTSNGTPRTGTETNPANLGLTYIIKY